MANHGQPTGSFVSAAEYEEMLRLKALVRRGRAVAGMTREEFEHMAAIGLSASPITNAMAMLRHAI